MSDQPRLEDVFNQALDSSDNDEISIEDISRAFGVRGFGPFITLLGFILIIPVLGGIPGVPVIVAAMILLLSFQLLLGRHYVWLPKFLAKRSIPRTKIEFARDKTKKFLRRIDTIINPRLTWAADEKGQYVAAIIVSLLALLLIPLGVIPFAVGIPGFAILLIGIALFARDGVLMLIAYALFAAAIYLLLAHTPIGGWIGF